MNLFAICATIGEVAVLWFGYFWLHPRLKKHFLLNLYFTLLFPVIMLTLMLILLVPTPWRWPINIDNLMYDFFIIRVGGMQIGPHIWVYMTIPILFFVARWIWRDEWRAFLASMLMVSIHEVVWFSFYDMRYLPLVAWNWLSELWNDVTLLIMLSAFVIVYWKKYSLHGIWIVVLPQFLYSLAWYAVGYPITEMNTQILAVAPYAARWHNSLWVNAVEVVSWWLLLAMMILWAWLNRRT